MSSKILKNKLTKTQKRILEEIEEINENFFKYPKILLQDKDSRTIDLEIDKQNLIRVAITFHHLLINEFFNLEISDYFIGRKKKIDSTKKNRIIYDNILNYLSFNEKFEIIKKITRANPSILGTIKSLNTIRNQLVHHLNSELEKNIKIRINYKGKNIFNMNSFRQLMLDCYYVKRYFLRRMLRK